MVKVNVSGIHYDVEKKDSDYAAQQFGKLSNIMSDKAKSGARVDVKITKTAKGSEKTFVEAILHTGDGRFVAKKQGVKLFPLLDSVAKKLKVQVEKKHARTTRRKVNRKAVLSKFRSLANRDFRGRQN